MARRHGACFELMSFKRCVEQATLWIDLTPSQVEQFVYTDPDKSWDAFESMIKMAEEFYQSLGLPYRVMAIVSGALNNAASKKYDLEAWFPFQGEYKELVSCSNCTDYQSRALEIRCGAKSQTDARKKYVYLLNCTLCATGRALCCIVENYQTEDVSVCCFLRRGCPCLTVKIGKGLRVPEVLRPYIRGSPDFIEYTKELPKDSTSLKVKGKAEKGPKPKVEPPPTTADGAEEAKRKMETLQV